MEYNEFPNCCGLTILAGVPREAGWHPIYDSPFDRERIIERFKDEIKTKLRDARRQTILAVNDKQDAIFGEIIREAGFKKLSQSYNYNTYNDIIVYSFIPEKATPRKAERVF